MVMSQFTKSTSYLSTFRCCTRIDLFGIKGGRTTQEFLGLCSSTNHTVGHADEFVPCSMLLQGTRTRQNIFALLRSTVSSETTFSSLLTCTLTRPGTSLRYRAFCKREKIDREPLIRLYQVDIVPFLPVDSLIVTLLSGCWFERRS
jgi:hypothetical protein